MSTESQPTMAGSVPNVCCLIATNVGNLPKKYTLVKMVGSYVKSAMQLRECLMDRLDDFYNELLLGFAMPDRMFAHKIQKTRNAKENFFLVRRGLMDADRFFVSDELVAEAVKMSFMPPSKLLRLIEFARPCMNNMWIEWNETRRVELVRQHLIDSGMDERAVEPIDYDSLPSKVGYHSWRLSDYYLMMENQDQRGIQRKLKDSEHADDTYVYHNYMKDQHGKLMCPTHAWYVSLNDIDTRDLLRMNTVVGAEGRTIRSPDMAKDELHQKSREMVAEFAFGSTYWSMNSGNWSHVHSSGKQKNNSDGSNRDVFDSGAKRRSLHHRLSGHKHAKALANKVSASYHELTYAFHTPNTIEDKQNELFKASCVSMDGDQRFLLCLNAMINYPHFVIKKEGQVNKQQRSIGGRRMPMNELNVLQLELPKPHGVTWYVKKFANVGSPKRKHKRRGHDRYIKLADGTVVRRWIEEQWVGNEELGVITHEYDLVKKG